MSSLIFHTLDVYLHEGYGRESAEWSLLEGSDKKKPTEPPDRSTSLTIRVTPDPDTRVKLTTGEDFKTMKGVLELKPSDESRPIASEDKSLNQIGYIMYSEEYRDGTFHLPASYQMSALIPRSQFDHLSSILRQARMPVSMFIEIEGMTHPDEHSLRWDAKEKKYLPLVSVKFSVRAAHFPAIDWDNEQEVGSLMPATRADLRAAIQAVEILTQRINARLNWLLAGVVVLVAGLLWRHW